MSPTSYPQASQKRFAPAEDYLFVNNVRFLAMAAVVMVHSLNLDKFLQLTGQPSLVCHLIVEFLKFGTIAFFLVSGFLAGEKLEQSKPVEYMKRRLKYVFLPWLVWLAVGCLTLAGRNVQGKKVDAGLLIHLILSLPSYLNLVIFHSLFWFVPNLLFGLCILLLCRRFLPDAVTGSILLACSLFYGINIYAQWIPSEYTQALGAFVFYLWLGTWAAWHYGAIQAWLTRIAIGWFLGLAFITFLAVAAESRLIHSLRIFDDTNSVSITNQIYSVAFVLLILKFNRVLSPKFIRVRATTFGIYLTHSTILNFLAIVCKRYIPHLRSQGFWPGELWNLAVSAVLFAIAYSGALLLAEFLGSRPGLRWMIGPGSPVQKLKEAPSAQSTPLPSGSGFLTEG